jgi:hypothetical protein
VSETLASLVASARNLLSETSTKFFDTAAANDHANRAQNMVFADAPWVFPAAYSTLTVPGCPTYLLPARMVIPSATYVQLTSGVPFRLNYWPPAIIDQYRQYASARPSQNMYMCTYRVTELGTCVDLLFEPSARQVLTVFGYQQPVKLVNDTDVSDIAEWAAHVLIQRIYVAFKTMDEENAEVQIGDPVYEKMLSDLRARRMHRQMDQLNMTRPMRGFSRGRFPWLG